MIYIILGIVLFIIAVLTVIIWTTFFVSAKKVKYNPPASIVHRNIVAVGEIKGYEFRCPVCKGVNPSNQAHCSLCGFYLYYIPNDFTVAAYRYYKPTVKDIMQYKRRERFIPR